MLLMTPGTKDWTLNHEGLITQQGQINEMEDQTQKHQTPPSFSVVSSVTCVGPLSMAPRRFLFRAMSPVPDLC